MKKELSKSTVIIVIAAVILIAGLIIWKGTSQRSTKGLVDPVQLEKEGKIDYQGARQSAQDAYIKWKESQGKSSP
jgi:hypothetical protein